jgi:hypothetical protein
MKTLTTCAVLLALSLLADSAIAKNSWSDWTGHSAPLTFLFGNDFDTHQQSQIRRSGDLSGFLYIRLNGIVTDDGYRIASHADCNAVPDCSVGWTMTGKPRDAAFLYHAMDDHPVFLIDRSQIPQPGGYAHFHRIGSEEHSSGAGYVLQLVAVQRFCFVHHEADAADASKTCEENGGVAVAPGLDIATHLNLVTSAPHEM